MTPEPGSWLDPDPLTVEEYVTTQPQARRSVVIPLILVAAVVALGLVAWWVAVPR